MNKYDKILSFINDKSYVPMKKKDIMAILQIPKEDEPVLSDILQKLESNGDILLSSKNKYLPIDKNIFLKGTFSAKEQGFAFVTPIDGGDDIFVSSDNTKNAMDGDTVLVKIYKKAKNNKKAEGEVFKITSHAHCEIVGTFSKSMNFGFVIPDDKKIKGDIFVPKSKCNNAKDRQKVVVTITKWPEDGRKAEGEITEILGYGNDIGMDVLCILKKHGIEQEFPKEVINNVNIFPNDILPRDLKDRDDFRENTIITIDGADSKDLDDAISVTKGKTTYTLGVHIADVSHYVTENSPLDKEAFKRGTSVYFTDRVVPMLPKRLSNDLCSLNPNVDRLTLSAIMTIDFEGNLVSHRICKSVIKSKYRMTYDEVSQILDGNKSVANKYSEIKDNIFVMAELAKLLRKNRLSQGSIDFDFPETKIEVNHRGEPIDVYKYTTGISNHIIEEFMLMANKTVAEEFFWLNIPFVYRVHEVPSLEKLTAFNEFLKPMGLKIRKNDPHPMEFSKMLEKIKGTDKETIVAKVMLRSLMKAKYSEENQGHFGLAFRYYCHFTSPIRRYPDLCIHRIIKEHIDGKLTSKKREKLISFTQKCAFHSSEAELKAMEAEREVEDMKKAEYMISYIGYEFDAVISSVTSFGFFAELENGIEGLIHMNDLKDDYYIFNELDYTLIGERTGKIYKPGDKIKIIVANANKELKQIDFIPASKF